MPAYLKNESNNAGLNDCVGQSMDQNQVNKVPTFRNIKPTFKCVVSLENISSRGNIFKSFKNILTYSNSYKHFRLRSLIKNSHKTLIEKNNVLDNNSPENIKSYELITDFKSGMADITSMLKTFQV